MNGKKNFGRPPKDANSKPIYENSFYKFLLATLPLRLITDDGRIKTAQLALETNRSRKRVYDWLNGERLSSRSAQSIIEISKSSKCERKGAITKDNLSPFVLGF